MAGLALLLGSCADEPALSPASTMMVEVAEEVSTTPVTTAPTTTTTATLPPLIEGFAVCCPSRSGREWWNWWRRPRLSAVFPSPSHCRFEAITPQEMAQRLRRRRGGGSAPTGVRSAVVQAAGFDRLRDRMGGGPGRFPGARHSRVLRRGRPEAVARLHFGGADPPRGDDAGGGDRQGAGGPESRYLATTKPVGPLGRQRLSDRTGRDGGGPIPPWWNCSSWRV